MFLKNHKTCVVHGQTKTKAHRAWSDMKTRCLNKNYKNYHRYGGRGIEVYPLWINNFQAFINCIGLPPTSSHSLDRIDNDGHYEPNNVRWATPQEQAINRKTTKFIRFDGVVDTMAGWAKRSGLSKSCVRRRLQSHSVKDTFTHFPYQLYK